MRILEILHIDAVDKSHILLHSRAGLLNRNGGLTLKRIGLGSISLLLFVCGILFSFSFDNGAAYGDSILRFLGLSPWSNGNSGLHFTMFYALVLYIPALILGYKFKNNFGAKIGRILSLVMIVCLLVATPFLGAV